MEDTKNTGIVTQKNNETILVKVGARKKKQLIKIGTRHKVKDH